MNIGSLNHEVTLERCVGTRDAQNFPVTSWETIATVWAAKQYRKGKETVEADQLTGIETVHFLIRYRTDLNHKDRVEHNRQYFHIRAIQEIGRQEGLRLVCEFRDNDFGTSN